MKDIKYKVTLGKGCSTMYFVFDDIESAGNFAKMALCNHAVTIGYDGSVEKFWANVDLTIEEESEDEESATDTE